MRIGAAGAGNINVLQSDIGQFRNTDFVTDQGNAFVGGCDQIAVAAQYSEIQMYNPAASGVTVLIDKVIVSSDLGVQARLMSYSTPLTTDQGSPKNRKIGSSVGAAELRVQAAGLAFDVAFGFAILLGRSPIVYEFKYPIELVEGEGFGVYAGTVNVRLVGIWFTREI